MTLNFDPHGLHFTEFFAEPNLIDLLPGLLPTDLDPGDDWDDSLMQGEED